MPESIEPDEHLASLKDGTRLLLQHKPTEALPLLLRANELKPDDVLTLLNLGGAYVMAGKQKLGVPYLERASELDPNNAQIWGNLGAAYLGNPVTAPSERQLKALEAFQRALDIDPKARSVAYNMGLIHRDRGERGLAIAAFQRALEADPLDRDAEKLLRRLEAAGGNSSDSNNSN